MSAFCERKGIELTRVGWFRGNLLIHLVDTPVLVSGYASV